MINRLSVTEKDLPKLVGTMILSVSEKEHSLVFCNTKEFIFEKRLSTIVYSDGRYGLAKHCTGYNIKFREPNDFVNHINTIENGMRFYCIPTERQLKKIHEWQIEELRNL